MNILYANSALCELKRGRYQECIKSCRCALEYVANNPKVYYRMAQAYKAENDFDRAQENFKQAIKLAPGDSELRTEYQKLMEIKNAKEKQWYSKMKGFYHKEGVNKIIEQDERREILREKIRRQNFHEHQVEAAAEASISFSAAQAAEAG